MALPWKFAAGAVPRSSATTRYVMGDSEGLEILSKSILTKSDADRILAILNSPSLSLVSRQLALDV
jgi:hypothetical protein